MIVAFFKFTRRELGLRQSTSVIGLARILRCNRHCLWIDRQRASCCCYQIVPYCGLRSCRYGYSVNRRDHIRLGAHIRDRAVFGHHYREGMIISSFQGACRKFGLRQSTSVIGLARILRCDRHCLRTDGQCAGKNRDRVVFGHIFGATHDLVACSNRVVTLRRISHVRHAAGCGRHQRITFQQAAAGYGYLVVAVNGSVIRPALARCCDCQRSRNNIELPCLRCNCKVSSVGGNRSRYKVVKINWILAYFDACSMCP